MEGTDDNKCLPSDMWMSHIDPQFSGTLGGNASLRDARTMSSSPAHLDLSRKQPPLYSNYDLPGGHYKSNAQAVTSGVMQQQFAPPSTRSAWEFATENFSSTPKDFTSQTLSQPVSNTTSRYSQSIHDYPMQNVVSQPPAAGRHFTPPRMTQSSFRDFPQEGVPPPQQSAGDFRERTAHSMSQQQTTTTDRSVWSHLYSLDPSIASYGSMSGHGAQSTPNFPQDKPYSYTLPHPEGTGGASAIDRTVLNRRSALPEKPPLVLCKVTSSEQLSASYMNRSSSSLPADSIPISSLAPTLYSNVLGTASSTKQNQPVDFADDQLGGYSPVSPPTQDSPSPFSALSNEQTTDLSMKNDNYIMSSSLSDFSSLNTSKPLPVNHFMRSNPSMLQQVPHDVPLDMTKGWSSSNTVIATTTPVTCSVTAPTNQSVAPTAHSFGGLKEGMAEKHSGTFHRNQFAPNQLRDSTSNIDQLAPNKPAVTASLNQFVNVQMDTTLNQLATNQATFPTTVNQLSTNKLSDPPSLNQFATPTALDTTSLNQMTTNKPSVTSSSNQFATDPPTTQFATDDPSDTPSVNQVTQSSQKVARKKSNFYGRDASFFSVPEISQPNVPTDGYTIKNMSINSSDANMDTVSSQMDCNPGLLQNISNSKSQIPVNSESPISSNNDSNNTTSFGDAFLDATTAPNMSSAGDSNSKGNQHSQIGSADIPIESVDTSHNANVSEAIKQKEEADLLEASSNTTFQNEPAEEFPEHEFAPTLGVDPARDLSIPKIVVSTRGRKAPRGRKRKGAATNRRQPKKAAAKTLPLVAENINAAAAIAGLDESVVMSDANDVNSNLIMETATAIAIKPAPKPRARRGRKRNLSADLNNPESEDLMTRRSSSRRSKDNAMRLIELQAESIYGHVVKPVDEDTPPQPPATGTGKTRRKAATAAVKSKTFSDSIDDGDLMGDKDISDEMSDEKDADYAVDEDDVESMKKDELLDMTGDQKRSAVQEKKAGGLKISIKLGVDSSAEIVSGIVKSPPRKKRKAVKKKTAKQQFKSKALIQDDDDDGGKEEKKDMSGDKEVNEGESKVDSELSESKDDKKVYEKDVKNDSEEKGDVVDRHNSLMDKYFSSATQARQIPKPGSLKKLNKVKKHETSKGSKSAKIVKVSTSKTVSISSTVPSSADSNSTPDTGVPKFVCGYCPNRYHNKQELLTHMEAHMAEMEEKPDKISAGNNNSKEPKKAAVSQSSKKSDSGKNISPKMGKKIETAEELKYNCGECGKSFPSKPDLLDHVRTHAAEKPFECNLCHKFFKERDELSVHRKVHIQEGLLRCTFCGKGFVNNSDLAAHMESHPKRSKSGPPIPKHIGFDNVKKGSNSNSFSDSSKKSLKAQQISRDKETKEEVNSKPTSFASALEPSSEKENPTLLLRRNDGSSSKDEFVKTSKSTKSESNSSKTFKQENIKKSSSAVKVQDLKKDSQGAKKEIQNIKKESKEIQNVKKESKEFKTVKKDSKESQNFKKDSKEIQKESKDTKSGDQKSNIGIEQSVKSAEIKEEKDNNASGECTCQECPECVTRFLQSFE